MTNGYSERKNYFAMVTAGQSQVKGVEFESIFSGGKIHSGAQGEMVIPL